MDRTKKEVIIIPLTMKITNQRREMRKKDTMMKMTRSITQKKDMKNITKIEKSIVNMKGSTVTTAMVMGICSLCIFLNLFLTYLL